MKDVNTETSKLERLLYMCERERERGRENEMNGERGVKGDTKIAKEIGRQRERMRKSGREGRTL